MNHAEFAILGSSAFSETVHYDGLPPALSRAGDAPKALPTARVIVICSDDEGTFLVRYAQDGAFAGDTWHCDVDEAKAQADFEYGEHVGKWQAVPDGADPAAFALSQVM